ncbi:hypothetical protein A0J61_07131 [Choanephora cucurbitarum]|uniref:C2H2-type domain-containing protein n=1 Tax=Choanephora cucurbitarum TaxID=101091 RepID=A0A1C7N6P5_9FUNG|nr:hypothetical protein A0J61_07131 [Choanephora cucurbitarum]
MLASLSNTNHHHHIPYGWPLGETEEKIMTLATLQQQKEQEESNWRSLYQKRTAVRCQSCHRKFHSKGNLANHQQLYQHS